MANTKVPVELSSTPSIVDNGNATAITIDSSENVQIGSNSFATPRLQLYAATTGESQIFFGNDGTNGFKDGAIRYFHESHATTSDRRNMTFSTANTERMRINATGVGIGTSSPGVALDVNGESNTQLRLTASDSNGASMINFGDQANAAVGRIIYSHVNDSFSFKTNNVNNRLVIDSSGNVGIGVTPTSKLDLEIDTDKRLTFSGGISEIGSVAGFQSINSAGSALKPFGIRAEDIRFATGSSERMRINSSGQVLVNPLGVSTPSFAFTNDTNTGITRPTGDTLQFVTGGSERMRIAADGRVGIGDSSPTRELSLKKTTDHSIMSITTSASNLAGIVMGDTADDDQGGIIYNNNGDYLYFRAGDAERMRIDSVGETTIKRAGSGGSGVLKALNLNHAGTSVNDGAKISFTAGASTEGAGIASTGQALNSADLRFYAGGNTERMRIIESNGSILMGKTANSIDAQGHWFRNNGESFHTVLNTDNTLHVYDTTNNVYRFYVTGGGTINATSTSITAISDERLKENIVDLETGLSEVMSLQPRRFDWKNGDGENVAGFIAQEVETVLPDLIGDYKHEELEDAKAIKMGDMIPTLVKAIQEQQTIIDDLKTRIETLEG